MRKKSFHQSFIAPLRRYLSSKLFIRHWVWKLRQIGRPRPVANPVLHNSEGSTAELSCRRSDNRRGLFIEDRVPHTYMGSGYPRSNRILREMIQQGYVVTLYPLVFPDEEWSEVYCDIPHDTKVALGYGAFGLQQFLSEHKGLYDLILVSRPHNMAALKPFLAKPRFGLSKTRIIYDAESLFCLREIEGMRLQGKPLASTEVQQRISQEVGLARGCSDVICVSEQESRYFLECGIDRIHTLSYALEATPTPNSFANRKDILFVGALPDASPNTDSVIWFAQEIFPIIKSELGDDIKLILAGSNCGAQGRSLASDSIEVLGQVDDLTDLYNRARLFIAPTRLGAGIPLKVLEAAAHGLPVVGTNLVATQLGWQSEIELLAASASADFAAHCIRLYQDPNLWSELRSHALHRISSEYSPSIFSKKLSDILAEPFMPEADA